MLFTAASGILNMQTTAPNSNEPYRIVAGDISMLQSKLDEAAGAGYRLILANSAEKGQVALLLERAPGGELYGGELIVIMQKASLTDATTTNLTPAYMLTKEQRK